MKRVVWLMMFLFGLFVSVHSQEVTVDTMTTVVEAPAVDSTNEDEEYNDSEDEKEVISDTLLVANSWTFPADSIRKYRNQKDFHYITYLDSLLKDLQAKEKKDAPEKVQPVDPAPAFSIFQLLLWLIAIGVVLFVIYRLFLSEKGLFAAPTRNKQIELEDEPITDDEYINKQLREAIQSGNYRLAVRYLYLQSLAKLAEKGWVILSPDKTNYQYVKELTKPHLKNDFSRVTLHYDYVWYGDFEIEQDVFQMIKSDFDQFQTKIRQA